MSVVQEIAKFMRALLDEVRAHRAETKALHDAMRLFHEGQVVMGETVQTLKQKLLSQAGQIDQLVKAKTDAEQADLDAIGAAIDSNTAKMTAAPVPAAA